MKVDIFTLPQIHKLTHNTNLTSGVRISKFFTHVQLRPCTVISCKPKNLDFFEHLLLFYSDRYNK